MEHPDYYGHEHQVGPPRGSGIRSRRRSLIGWPPRGPGTCARWAPWPGLSSQTTQFSHPNSRFCTTFCPSKRVHKAWHWSVAAYRLQSFDYLLLNYTSYRLSVTIPSKSCPSTSMCYLLSHGSYPRELLPPGNAPSAEQRHRTQIPHLRLPHLNICGSSSRKLPLLGAYKDISQISLRILEIETDDHSLCSLQCVGLLLILLMRYLARESASIYVFSPIIKKTVSRRTFGLPLTTNDTTSISVREVPCA